MSQYGIKGRWFKALLIAVAVAFSFPDASLAQESIANLVSIPEIKRPEYSKHTPLDDDSNFPSSSYPILTLKLRRARNLLAAGHFDEAVKDYSEGYSESKWPVVDTPEIDSEWGAALEGLGQNELAIKRYKYAKAFAPLTILLLKMKRYDAALKIANSQIPLAERTEFNEGSCLPGLVEWLRMRAVAEVGLRKDQEAVRDLYRAAQIYYIYDAGKSAQCLKEANRIIACSKLGEPLSIKENALPHLDSEKVFALIEHLATTKEPFALDQINSLTGTHLTAPEKFFDLLRVTEPPSPFSRLSIQVKPYNSGSHSILSAAVSTNLCCLPKNSLLKIFPATSMSVLPKDFWNGDDQSSFANAWRLPGGILKLTFTKGGAQVLTGIEFSSIEFEQSSVATSKSALSEPSNSVLAAGRFQLNKQSILEEQAGKFELAIEHLITYIGDHPPGPETEPYFTRLAGLYLKMKNYPAAIAACEKAMINSRYPSDALFIRAKAEAEQKNYVAARRDARAAALGYFDNASIVLRDQVNDWIMTLPAN